MFDFKTLTYYGAAGGVGICLGILLLTFSWLQPDTRSARSSAVAILILSLALIVAAYGPLLPRGVMVLGTNMMLIGAGVVMHSGFVAFCEDRKPRIDWHGWAIVAATAFPFWYWGFVEPDGHFRSAVFSFAVAAITGRTTISLVGHARGLLDSTAIRTMGLLFAIVAIWMTVRGFMSAFAEAPAPLQRGNNPTTWDTVLAFILLISLITAATIWLEISRLRSKMDDMDIHGGSVLGAIGSTRTKLLLLWGTAMVLNIGIISGVCVLYMVFFEAEKDRLTRTTELANDAFVEYTAQVVKRVDTVLHSARSFYQRTRSLSETGRFVAGLQVERSVLDNVYLIDTEGRVVLSPDPAAIGRSVADRAYYPFHRGTTADEMFVSPVERGWATGKYNFLIMRRIDNPDGSFGGLVLATVAPEEFSRYYGRMLPGAGMLASLLGSTDHKLRARAPAPLPDLWSQELESPIWAALKTSSSGSFENVSAVDGVRRNMVYRQVPGLPLVMLTGFSADDLIEGVLDRTKWLAAGATVVLGAILGLAALLTVEILRRDEQDRFMSMLNHELKTPLAVIRMSLGDESLPVGVRERVTRSVTDMNAIVERSLQADRLRHGHIQINRQECPVGELLASLVSDSVSPAHINLEVDELPMVTTDAQLLGVILGNLIDNALKYGAPGKPVTVNAGQAARKTKPGVSIAVTNRPGAAGMPDARKVFRKYYRAPGAHSKTGSGLGLHISAGLADKLGGHLSYVPSPDEVRFELWLPS